MVELTDEQLAAGLENPAAETNPPPLPPDGWQDGAKQMRARGKTVKQVAEHYGVSEKQVQRATKRDRAPRGKKPKRATAAEPKATRAQTIAIERILAQAFTAPVIPAVMLAPDEPTKAFMQAHFQGTAPKTAHTLAVASESWPELREVLEKVTTGGVKGTVVLALGGLAIPPILWTLGLRGPAIVMSGAGQLDEQAFARMAAEQQAEDPFAREARDRGPGGAYYEPPADAQPAEPPVEPSAPAAADPAAGASAPPPD